MAKKPVHPMEEVKNQPPNPSLLLETFLAFPCPVHGWESGVFCDHAFSKENRRNWKVLRVDVIRDASEQEVEDTAARPETKIEDGE